MNKLTSSVVFLLVALNVPMSPAEADQQTKMNAVLPIIPEPIYGASPIDNPTPIGLPTLPMRFMIFWNDAPSIDGDFVLVIHPTQIFLRSMHNNPNPGSVYWVASLSAMQNAALVKFLDTYSGTEFSKTKARYMGYQLFDLAKPKVSPWLKENSTLADQDRWIRESEQTINANLRRVLLELNRAMPSSLPRIPADSRIGDMKHRLRIKDY